ncbi:hypothetical protein J3E69DRAFT_243799 [Trichoderma sp. SZMC 28015]
MFLFAFFPICFFFVLLLCFCLCALMLLIDHGVAKVRGRENFSHTWIVSCKSGPPTQSYFYQLQPYVSIRVPKRKKKLLLSSKS